MNKTSTPNVKPENNDGLSWIPTVVMIGFGLFLLQTIGSAIFPGDQREPMQSGYHAAANHSTSSGFFGGYGSGAPSAHKIESDLWITRAQLGNNLEPGGDYLDDDYKIPGGDGYYDDWDYYEGY